MWWNFVCIEHPSPPRSCLWSSFLVWYRTKIAIKDKNTMKGKRKRDSPLPLSSSIPVGRLQRDDRFCHKRICERDMKTFWFSNLLWFKKTEHSTCLQQFTCNRMQCSKLVLWKGHHLSVEAGVDPGFIFLQNTSCIRKPGHLRVGGGGGAHLLHPLLGPPLRRYMEGVSFLSKMVYTRVWG